MVYQLESPDINTVINYCKDLCAKAYNLVTISTFRNGKAVDDTGDIHVSELDAELERINSYEDFGIL